MFDHLLESSHRDDSNKWSNLGFVEEIGIIEKCTLSVALRCTNQHYVLQGICDGAAALVLASEEACTKHNLTPLARLVSYGIAGMKISYFHALRNVSATHQMGDYRQSSK